MKCDKLQRYTLDVDYEGNVISVENDDGGYMDAYEVYEAIAELKQKLEEKDEEIDKQKWRGDEWAKACNQKDKEIESLKATAYADNVDAGMRERRLHRALWIARAELCRRLDVDRYLRKHNNSWYNENCLTWADACVAMEVKMCKAESKCLKKAEEYK